MIQVLKKINNNVALCKDSDNRDLIAFSKGIGFKDMPYNITDMSIIDRTFYSVKNEYISLLQEIPEDITKLCIDSVDYAKSIIEYEINENLYFVLADHINFAIQRARQGIFMQTYLFHDIQSYHVEETEIALKIVSLINKKYDIELPQDEAGIIAMHIFQNELRNNNEEVEINHSKVTKEITEIVEREFDIIIDKTSFNYSRFISHLQYLLIRRRDKIKIVSDNHNLFEEMKKNYRKSYECANEIKKYFIRDLDWDLTDEEILYLILHINRMSYREDCNQKGITS